MNLPTIRLADIARLRHARLALLLAALTGCSTPATDQTGVPPDAENGSATAADGGPAVSRTSDTGPSGVSRTLSVRAAVLPLGTVPADGFSLPLLSPDGRFVATQTGVAPEWSTALAEVDAPLPEATSVEIHEAVFEQRRVTLAGRVGEGLLLGRQSDAEGLLVEMPRSDGSRWIGRASWSTRQIQWLVQDDATNAFATAGPDGQLAWSRRPPGGERFELVVRDAAGATWTLGDEGQDWLMPTWSGKGPGLFALLLEGSRLDVVHMLASTPTAARQSLRRLTLSTNASTYTAYQVMNGQPLQLGSAPLREQLVFYHPRQHRAALWRPNAVERDIIMLGRGAITAVIDAPGFALTPTDSDLELIDFERRSDPKPLLKGLLIPRPTPDAPYPYVLLTPRERQVGLTAMQLLE